MKDWNSKAFYLNQEYALYCLTRSKTIIDIMNKYIQKEKEYENRLPRSNWTQSPTAKFCELSSACLNKLNLIIETYLTFCEADLHDNSLPSLANLLFSYNIEARMGFSKTLVQVFKIGDTLIDNLEEHVPELYLKTVRDFETWTESVRNEVKVPDQ